MKTCRGAETDTRFQTRPGETRCPARPLSARVLLFLFTLSGSACATAVELEGAILPAGTVFELRLQTAVSTKASHLHSDVTARVVRDVSAEKKIAIPVGSVVRGRIEKLIPSSNPSDRARLLLQFTSLEITGEPPIKVVGHLKEVENARESFLSDGTIQGLLANELPLAHLGNAVGKLGKDSEVQKVITKNLGKPDTSIEYPVGTDFAYVLDGPLTANSGFDPTVPDVLTPGSRQAIDRLLADAPQRASGKDGAAGDPLNLVLIGREDEIRKAFQEAGWNEAARKNARTIFETVRAVMAEKGYGAAPVSQLYLYGRPEDFAFEKTLNTFTKRHHLRLWRSTATTPEGREIWLGAATHDTGLDVRPGVVSHAIDPDLDAERAKVGADLAAGGQAAVESLVARPNPISQGSTATGAPWRTDGQLLAVQLK